MRTDATTYAVRCSADYAGRLHTRGGAADLSRGARWRGGEEVGGSSSVEEREGVGRDERAREGAEVVDEEGGG